jgi:hypothetical protein
MGTEMGPEKGNVTRAAPIAQYYFHPLDISYIFSHSDFFKHSNQRSIHAKPSQTNAPHQQTKDLNLPPLLKKKGKKTFTPKTP